MTRKELSKLVHYNPKTGSMTWKKSRGSVSAGMPLKSKHKDGYFMAWVNKKLYLVHRLAWLYVTGEFPKQEIDHINGDRTDNRIKNLQDVSKTENQKNASIRIDNTSGMTGISFRKQTKKWRAYINHNSKIIYLGQFVKKEDAIKIRKEANKKYNYHEGHGKPIINT